MYMTDFNGKRYVFFDDRVTVNGIPIPYAEMTNIAHRRGDVPAFLFDYRGRRFALPYRMDEIRSILPYFQKAAGITAAPEPMPEPAAMEPAVVQSMPEPAAGPAVFDAPVISTPYEESFADPVPADFRPVDLYAAPASDTMDPYAAPEPETADPYAAPSVYDEAPAFEETPSFTEASTVDTMPAFTDDAEPFANDAGSFTDPTDSFAEPAEPFPEPDDPFAQADEANLFALGDEPPSPEDQAKKPFWTPVKIIIAALVAAAILVVILFSCHKNGTSDAPEAVPDTQAPVTEETAAPEDAGQDADAPAAAAPAAGDAVEATDGFTAGDEDGTMQVVLKKAYVGDAALDKLADMGENRADYTEDDDPGYKLVVYEYEVDVKTGSLIGDPITGEMFLPDRSTELDDWYSYDLYANQDKDLAAGELDLAAGTKATVYCAYGMPADLTDYYELVYTNANEDTIWVHYVLEDR